MTPAAGGWELVGLGSSMTPTFESGDRLWVQPCAEPSAVAVGDVVVFERDGVRSAHRLRWLDRRTGLLVTRGDACLTDDEPVPWEAVKGRVVAVRREPGPWRALPASRSIRTWLLRPVLGSIGRGHALAVGWLDACGAGAALRGGALVAGERLGLASVGSIRPVAAADLPALQRLLRGLAAGGRRGVPTIDEILAMSLTVAQLPGGDGDSLAGVIGLRALAADTGDAVLEVVGPLVRPVRGWPLIAVRLLRALPGVAAPEGAVGGASLMLRAVPRTRWEAAVLTRAGFHPVAGSAAPDVLMLRHTGAVTGVSAPRAGSVDR